MPWDEIQFWIVSLVALAGLYAVLRPLLPSNGASPSCPSCTAKPGVKKPKLTPLTISKDAKRDVGEANR
ncbi:MAG: hypothetical protein DWH76_00780 [Planctomycetota bacterium]|jgi:hypothetical protein|nr:MAG: hypothetical protein DWH76_00780 [Planctomycetota bacterium]